MTPTCEHEGCDNLATYMGEGGIYLCDVPHYAPRRHWLPTLLGAWFRRKR